jgi:hypothetical protein
MYQTMTVANSNLAFLVTIYVVSFLVHKTCARSNVMDESSIILNSREHKFLRVQTTPKSNLKPNKSKSKTKAKQRNLIMNMNILSDQSEGDEEEIIIQEQNNNNNNSQFTSNTYQWTWDHNHHSNPNRVLVVQDASPGPDEVVLSVTSKVNRAYAKRWRFDYLQFTGIALVEQLQLVDDDNPSTGSTAAAATTSSSSSSGYGNFGNTFTNNNSDSWMATFNKPFLLRKLVQAKIDNQDPNHEDCVTNQTDTTTINNGNDQNQPSSSSTTNTTSTSTSCNLKPHIDSYDIVLFLDSSAIIVQLDYNILNLIQPNKMIATSMPTIINNNDVNDAHIVQEVPVVVSNNNNNVATFNNNDNDNSNNNPNGNNVDVMLWNLNHPETNHYSNIWMEECFQQYTTAYNNNNNNNSNNNNGDSNTNSNMNGNMNANNNSIIITQSEVILSKILIQETSSENDTNNNDLEQQSQNDKSLTANSINNNNISNNGNSNSNGNNNINHDNDIINPIPKEMVNGLQGTLIKQDMSYNYYMINDDGLRQVMPLLSGISDSVCYRFYPQCEVI